MSAERSVTIKIIGDAKSAQTAFSSVEVSAGKADTSLGKIATTAAGVAIGGALTQLPGLLLDGARGAAEDAASLDRLKQAIENTGTSYDTYGGAVDAAIKRGQDLAFTDGETSSALAKLISLTGSTEEGMNRLAVAQDLARGAGISLEQAALLLGKTSDENTAALGRMGIKLGENATAQDVLNTVDAKFGGQAGVYAASSAGQMAIATQQAGELAESFGTFLIPVITLLTGALLSVAAIIQSDVVPAVQGILNAFLPVGEFIAGFVTDNIGPLVAALAGIGAAILVTVIPALVAWVVGMVPVIASHVAMAAAVVVAYAPVIAIMAAVGLAAAALYMAWDSNLLGIQDITRQVLDFIGPYFDTVVGAIRTVVETVFPVIATVVTTYINILKAEIELALGIIQTVWGTVFPAIQAVVETVFPIIASVVGTQIEIARAAIDTGVNAIKWVFDNILVPIQGIVQNVFDTIAGIVSTVWGATVTAIEIGVNTAKTVFDGLVAIQGIVSDVFVTISGLVDSLWNGASGAVSKIGGGLDTIYGFFAGVYDTMAGYGRDIVQGLIDGVGALFDTLQGWIDKITGLLKIDVPGFSPPYDAGRKQGASFMQGLTDGIASGFGAYDRRLRDVAAGLSAVGGTIGLGGSGGGVATGAGAPVAAAGSGSAPRGSGGGSTSGNQSQGMLALRAGATFLGCGMELIGQDNGLGLFLMPDGKKKWLDSSFCKGGKTGPSAAQLTVAPNGAAGAATPQGSRLVSQTRTQREPDIVVTIDGREVARASARYITGARRLNPGLVS